MTNQEKKEWLKKYTDAELVATRLREEIARLYSTAERTTTTLKMVPGGSSAGSKIEDAVEAIESVAADLAEQQMKAMRLRRNIEEAISTVPDGKQQLVLQLKYIDNRSWEEVAEAMGISRQWATQLHGRALDKMQTTCL